MTISDILEYFRDINYAYNDCMRYSDLKRMLYQLVFDIRKTTGGQFPKLRWQPFDKIREGSELEEILRSIYNQCPYGVNIILYGRQKYAFMENWDYISVLVAIDPNEEDPSKFDVAYDWDYDEGQEYREWIAFADIDNIGTYEAGKMYEELYHD